MKNCITSFTVCVILASFLLTAGCEKTEKPESEPLTDYLNLQVGKYVRYRLDSTLYIHFGQVDTVISYQAKDVVDGAITDILGRPGWRIVRYLRDTASTKESDWNPVLAYFVIPDGHKVEIIENTLRYIKLNQPIWDGHTWKGNGFLPTDAYKQFEFSNDGDIQNWDYTLQDVGVSETIGNKNYDNTFSVLQVDDSDNLGDDTFISWKNYWIEKYSKGIGLVYKEVIMWEHQPPNQGNVGYTNGFGLKMTIIDHN